MNQDAPGLGDPAPSTDLVTETPSAHGYTDDTYGEQPQDHGPTHDHDERTSNGAGPRPETQSIDDKPCSERPAYAGATKASDECATSGPSQPPAGTTTDGPSPSPTLLTPQPLRQPVRLHIPPGPKRALFRTEQATTTNQLAATPKAHSAQETQLPTNITHQSDPQIWWYAQTTAR